MPEINVISFYCVYAQSATGSVKRADLFRPGRILRVFNRPIAEAVMKTRLLIFALALFFSAAALASSTFNEARDRFERGLENSYSGRYDEAISEYEASIRLNPNVAEVYNNLGFAYFDKGDLSKAVFFQRKAIEINPYLANGYYGLALALEALGDKNGALVYWKRYISLSSDEVWIEKAKEHIYLLEKEE